jgi:hypothetical protein
MLPEFLLAPRLIFLISSCYKKKEPNCACLSEARASHSQRIWAEVSSSTPHLLHNGLFDSVLLKDKNLALVLRQGPEISSRACLRVSPRTRHHPQCWLVNQRLILLISCLETPKAGSGLQTLKQGRPLRAHRWFHCLLPRHVQGPITAPQHARYRNQWIRRVCYI